jgi:hypothetical protein
VFVSRGVAHPAELVGRALELRSSGSSMSAVAAQLGLQRSTVARWCRGLIPADAAYLIATGELRPRCAACGQDPHDRVPAPDYAYLLGIYLGDGCLGTAGRSVALRIVMDDAYPLMIEEVVAAILAVRGGGTVSRFRPRGERCIALTSYTQAWRCLFPQHGAGKKHERPIVLRPWQQAIVHDHPGRFARGLIHSDGWRGTNQVHVKGRAYEYPRYQFSNRSDDIRRLFTDALDVLGVEWRPWGRFHISVAKHRSVALLYEHVGPKA